MESCGDRGNSQTTLSSMSKLEQTSAKNPAQVFTDLPRVTTRGSARFGNLSHHSFFSRHNPHPHRVTHISGLNGSPVCMVNDDWYTSTPLCPHPLIRSQVAIPGASPTSYSLPHHLGFGHSSGGNPGAGLLSDAWREELKDLATKVSASASGPSRRSERDDRECSREEEAAGRKTQYSAQTGRLIPASSWGRKRRDTQASRRRPGTHRPQPSILDGQELRVLELLCQILQTDSLSLVQQWLLLAGDREKELVQGLLQQALTDLPPHQEEQLPYTMQTDLSVPESLLGQSLLGQSLRKQRPRSLCSAQEAVKEKPERIGAAEVLQVHTAESQTISSHNSAHLQEHVH